MKNWRLRWKRIDRLELPPQLVLRGMSLFHRAPGEEAAGFFLCCHLTCCQCGKGAHLLWFVSAGLKGTHTQSFPLPVKALDEECYIETKSQKCSVWSLPLVFLGEELLPPPASLDSLCPCGLKYPSPVSGDCRHTNWQTILRSLPHLKLLFWKKDSCHVRASLTKS